MAPELKPAYLIAGTDEERIGAALARLRARAERDGGPGALQRFEPEGGAAPDAGALVAAIPAMSLTAERRYLLADHVERWRKGQLATVREALAALPPDLTVVLVARDAAPKGLAKAVETAGGEVISYEAPRPRELTGKLVADARRRGFELEPDAARLLVERMGTGSLRLANELDRLALWAGEGGRVSAADLAPILGDTSEEAAWALSDALLERRVGDAVRVAERLAAQGESVTGLVYALARRLRDAHRAAEELERGRSPRDVAAGLAMHPYGAKMLVRRVRGVSPLEIRRAIAAIADLELWTRGGSDYPEEVALTLAVRRAAGAGAGR